MGKASVKSVKDKVPPKGAKTKKGEVKKDNKVKKAAKTQPAKTKGQEKPKQERGGNKRKSETKEDVKRTRTKGEAAGSKAGKPDGILKNTKSGRLPALKSLEGGTPPEAPPKRVRVHFKSKVTEVPAGPVTPPTRPSLTSPSSQASLDSFLMLKREAESKGMSLESYMETESRKKLENDFEAHMKGLIDEQKQAAPEALPEDDENDEEKDEDESSSEDAPDSSEDDEVPEPPSPSTPNDDGDEGEGSEEDEGEEGEESEEEDSENFEEQVDTLFDEESAKESQKPDVPKESPIAEESKDAKNEKVEAAVKAQESKFATATSAMAL